MRNLTALALSALLIAGCGSDSSSISGLSGSANVNPGGSQTARQVFGRVLLEAPLQGATVQLTDLGGRPLPRVPTTTVDESGNFRLPTQGLLLPAEFRVVVNPPVGSPWNLPIVANVGNYNDNGIVFANILTTMVAQHRSQNSANQADSESWLRSLYKIPASVDIGYGVEESRHSPFTHSKFLQDAASRGGPATYLQQIVTTGVLPKSVFATIGSALGEKLGASILDLTEGNAIGFVAESLGLNVGNSKDIEKVSEQISELQTQIKTLSSDLQADFAALSAQLAEVAEAISLLSDYNTQVGVLDSDINEIQILTDNLVATSSTATITNAPFTPSSGVTALLTSLANFEAETALASLSDNLLGRNQLQSLLYVYLQLLSLQQGVSPQGITNSSTAPVWGYSPLISNQKITDRLQDFLDFYAGQQTFAFNLLVEQANASGDPATIANAQIQSRDYYQAIAQEQDRVPPPLKSVSFLSNPQVAFQSRSYNPRPPVPSGILYCTQVQSPTTAYNEVNTQFDPRFQVFTVFSDGGFTFKNQTEAFQLGNLPSGWRVMSKDEAEQLHSVVAGSNPQEAAANLIKLGFVPPTQWDGTVWIVDPDEANVQGQPVKVNGLALDFSGNYPFKVYNLFDGSFFGLTESDVANQLIGHKHAYIQVHYQSFGSDQPYDEVVAAGFRPTVAPTVSMINSTQLRALIGTSDVTSACQWSSSNNAQLEVSNRADNPGALLWHPKPGLTLVPQTITATMSGMDSTNGSQRTFSTTFSVPVPDPAPARTLKSIVVTPSNRILLNQVTTQFKAVAFYSDFTSEDVTESVTWSLQNLDGTPYPANQATITGSVQGALAFTGPVTDPDIVVVAVAESVTGKTRLEVEVP